MAEKQIGPKHFFAFLQPPLPRGHITHSGSKNVRNVVEAVCHLNANHLLLLFSN